uniref:Uncharacterized protein n=1 Tax=Babesia bovis TaxID=5865 RepID=A7ANK6_BABBO|eukprot:XP_001611708.1 hypothetical protein [Babesia bovis T2Bo]
MEVENQENIAELPYRASINPDAYEKCGQAYFHYFEELERLGPLDTSKMSSVARNYAGKKVKVGAKPLSGVRGIYYTRGTWRVQYRGTDGEIVSCVFNYDSKDVLIATFDLAFRLLRKVINLGRQVKSEDGMIITELTEERLLDLDRRSKMRKNKQDSTVTKDLLTVSSKRISRPRHDRLLAKGEDDIDSESDQIYTQVRKKTRPRTGDIAYNANVMTYQAPMPYVTASGNTMLPNTGCYPGKMDSFERMFHSYGNFTTHQLISYLIDKKCMRNKDRAPSVQRGGCQMGGEIQSTSGGEYGNEIYHPYDHELHSNEHSFNKDINGITNSGRLYRDDTNGSLIASLRISHNFRYLLYG